MRSAARRAEDDARNRAEQQSSRDAAERVDRTKHDARTGGPDGGTADIESRKAQNPAEGHGESVTGENARQANESPEKQLALGGERPSDDVEPARAAVIRDTGPGGTKTGADRARAAADAETADTKAADAKAARTAAATDPAARTLRGTPDAAKTAGPADDGTSAGGGSAVSAGRDHPAAGTGHADAQPAKGATAEQAAPRGDGKREVVETASATGAAAMSGSAQDGRTTGGRTADARPDSRRVHGTNRTKNQKRADGRTAVRAASRVPSAAEGTMDGGLIREIQVDLSESAASGRSTASTGEAPTETVIPTGDDGTVGARPDAGEPTLAGRQPTIAQATETLARRLNGDLGDAVVRQAKVMLQGADRAEVRLVIRPPELGRVRIRLQMENGHIAGRILVDNGNVREVVEQNLGALQRAFEEAGLEMGELEVSTGDARDNSADERAESGGTRGRSERSTAEVFDRSVRVISEYEEGRHRINLVA